jgi:hypothetical protein
VPWLPGIGAAFNWFLLAQLSLRGLLLIMAYIGFAILMYFLYGYRNSVGATTGWVPPSADPPSSRHEHSCLALCVLRRWREVLERAAVLSDTPLEGQDIVIGLLKSPVAATDPTR